MASALLLFCAPFKTDNQWELNSGSTRSRPWLSRPGVDQMSCLESLIVFFVLLVVSVVCVIRGALRKQWARQRAAKRGELTRAIVTAKGSYIKGRKIKRHLGAVFSKWQRIEFDSLPREYYDPDYDDLQMEYLVELTLKYKAMALGANAIINLRMRTFRNGCEGSGDAVLTTE